MRVVSLPLSSLEIGPMKATFVSLAAVAAVLLACHLTQADTKEPSSYGLPMSEWIARTKDREPNVRQYAANVIADMGPAAKSAGPAILALVKDKSAEVRAGAARALGAIGADEKTALPALVVLIEDDSADVRARAAAALRALGIDAKSSASLLVAMLHDDSAQRKSGAANSLDHFGSRAKEDMSAPLLDLSDPKMLDWYEREYRLGLAGAGKSLNQLDCAQMTTRRPLRWISLTPSCSIGMNAQMKTC